MGLELEESAISRHSQLTKPSIAFDGSIEAEAMGSIYFLGLVFGLWQIMVMVKLIDR